LRGQRAYARNITMEQWEDENKANPTASQDAVRKGGTEMNKEGWSRRHKRERSENLTVGEDDIEVSEAQIKSKIDKRNNYWGAKAVS